MITEKILQSKTGGLYPYIVVMKAGPYCDYNLEEIIKIKQKEESKCERFFWGYGGVFCRPHIINSFVSYAKANGDGPVVMFSKTFSEYKTSGEGRFTRFSSDQLNWHSLPKEVLLVGNKKAPHFAIVARNLRKVEISLNLNDYCAFNVNRGMFAGHSRYLSDYFRHRVDKACGFYKPKKSDNKRIVVIDYICELVEPYCVYIK